MANTPVSPYSETNTTSALDAVLHATGGADTAAARDAAIAVHTGLATAAHAATAISVAPFGSIAATNVQTALVEVVTEQLARAVRSAAGVPTGAPTAAELPLAYDSTAVSGGFYFWGGAAWVKVATILS